MKKQKKIEKMPLVQLISLGCAKNFVDTEHAAASLLLHGFGLANDDADADILFINTCSFLRSAREEVAEHLAYAAQWKKQKKGRLVIVGGCFPAWDKNNEYMPAYTCVDAWLQPGEISTIGTVAEALRAKLPMASVTPDPDAPRLQLTPEHYAWLRVADGCCNCCTYCLIPTIRGPLASRPLDSVVKEAENLVANGVKELMIIAQDTASYGKDLSKASLLPDLLKSIDKLDGDFFFRVLYLHPAHVTRKLLKTMEACDRIAPCLEMPIQHISDPVLQRMNRHISETSLRKVLDDVSDAGFELRTTLMTGFPGETEEDFEKLTDLVKEQQFMRMGVFAYSAEEGTPAYAMEDQVPAKVANARKKELEKLQKQISLLRNKALINTETAVIVDADYGDGTGTGRTLYDLPDIDNSVKLKGLDGTAQGEVIPVRITRADAYQIQATTL